MFINKLTQVGIATLFTFTSLSALADSPDPSEVYINNIVHGGTGCPIDTVAGDISEDGKAFTLLFDEYIVEAGPDIPRRDGRKSCQLTVNLHVPQGWSYSIFEVDYAGYAALDRGTSGEQSSTYYFQGTRGNKVKLATRLRGYMDDDYEISDRLGLSALVWSPCGVNRALNIKTALRVKARRGKSALMTLDSIDGEITHVYGFRWRRCR